MIINKAAATAILFEEAKRAESETVNSPWQTEIEQFSRVCDQTTRTHIAFLGTAFLAKAVDLNVDVWAVKARTSNRRAYSARGLAHGVLVPHAPALGINLGVTGREPLNNQPYFRIMRVARDIPIHSNAKPALQALCDILERLEKVSTSNEARAALCAFIFVRRQWNPTYGTVDKVAAGLSLERLIHIIEGFVSEDSEGGKRAQAIAAAVLDQFAGRDRVVVGRINDPDRHLPGDVGVRVADTEGMWEKVFEVRDKPVSEPDLYHFAQKSTDNNVSEAAIVAVAPWQPQIDATAAREWAAARGVSLTLFLGWEHFIRQAMFWASIPTSEGVRALPALVFARLVELEVSQDGAKLWRSAVADG
jgi:SacI restriction endonuclease